jgi:hypothetical protein
MSFEVYLQCFRGGEPAGIPLATARTLFPIVNEESEPDYWRVRYDAQNDCQDLGLAAPLRRDSPSRALRRASVPRPAPLERSAGRDEVGTRRPVLPWFHCAVGRAGCGP